MLKPASRDLDDDEWPCFVLKDAIIYHQDGVRIANPLLVDVHGPFVIRGHLAIDEEEYEQYCMPPLIRLHSLVYLDHIC